MFEKEKCALRDSNPRPSRCKRETLATELSAPDDERDNT